MTRYLVTGAGPVGATVALALAARGDDVTLATRSGSGPEHERITRTALDARDAVAVREAVRGVRAVFHCVHPSTYSAKAWAAELPQSQTAVLDAAAEAGAVVVFPENLYSWAVSATPMTAAGAGVATTGKGGVRSALLAARAAHRANTVSVAASDFVGPRSLESHAGDRLITPVLAGRRGLVIGSADTPHALTYVPDLAAAMIAAADTEAAWNTVQLAPTLPAITMRRFAEQVAAAAGAPAARLRVLPTGALKALGLVWGMGRELAETAPQFTTPWHLDSSATQALLGLAPTPRERVIAETLAWWRTRD